MVFSEIYKGPRSPLGKLRHHQPELQTSIPTATPDWVAPEHQDLLSRDKAKQKEALKRYLSTKVKNDWDFQWPLQSAVASPAKKKQRLSKHVTQETLQDGADSAPPADTHVQDEIHEDDGYKVQDDSCDESSNSDSDDDDTQSMYSVVSEDATHYRPRIEWTSDLSDDEPAPSASPFRFNSPDAVASEVQASIYAKRDRRRRELRKEIATNEGLACFEARRAAWTGAKTVRVRAKATSPAVTSPRSPRRFFFRRSMSGSPPASASGAVPHGGEGSGLTSDGSSLARETEKELSKQPTKDTTPSTPPSPGVYPVETLVPIAPPLLPPNNPLRASITPSVYLNLYDKVIVSNLQPSCPINLGDMLRSCVAGWKRDGEWPPRSAATMDQSIAARRRKRAAAQDGSSSNVTRRLSFGLLGRDKDDESRTGKGIRRSLQRALGIGHNEGHMGEKVREV